MTIMLIESLRPRNIRDIFIDPNILISLKSWITSQKRKVQLRDNKIKDRILIFHGKPGVGKTTTALLLAQGIMPICCINASDERKAPQMQSLLSQMMATNRCLFIIDEADNAKIPKEIVHTRNPVIIITNDFSKLPDWLRRKKLTKIPFKYPTKRQRITYLHKIQDKLGIELPIDYIASKCLSYRDMLNAIEKTRYDCKELEQQEVDLSAPEVLQAISYGYMSIDKRINMSPYELMAWLIGNTKYNPDHLRILSEVDLWIAGQKYHMWKYAYPMLYSFKGCGLQFPQARKKRKETEPKAEAEEKKVEEPQAKSIFSYL